MSEDKVPDCGKDFCEECGDCIACYGGENCYLGGEHLWRGTDPSVPDLSTTSRSVQRRVNVQRGEDAPFYGSDK